MHNVYAEFKKYLQFLSLEGQIEEINLFIDELINKNHPSINDKRKYNRIQQLKKLRHDILCKQ